MNRSIIILALALFGGTVIAQTSVQKAFESENAASLKNMFDTQVDIYIMDKDDRVSRAEAVSLVESFFKSHEVRSFTKVHSGSSRGQSSDYEMYDLRTDKGKFRTYIYYKSSSGSKVIRELRLESN